MNAKVYQGIASIYHSYRWRIIDIYVGEYRLMVANMEQNAQLATCRAVFGFAGGYMGLRWGPQSAQKLAAYLEESEHCPV